MQDGDPLQLIVDGKKITLRAVPDSYTQKVSGNIYEWIEYSVPAKFFEKLALANEVDVKVSGQKYYLLRKFNDGNKKDFDRFYQEIVLGQKYQEHRPK